VELSLENRLLVQNHEQVEGDENEGRVRKYRGAVEEPRLAHEDCEDAVVHGISGVTIKTADDKVARRIDWCEGALASREEVPDAAEQDESAEKDQGGSRDRGSTDRRNTQLVGREEQGRGPRAKTGSFVLDSIRRMRKGLGVVTDPSLPSTAALRKEHP